MGTGPRVWSPRQGTPWSLLGHKRQQQHLLGRDAIRMCGTFSNVSLCGSKRSDAIAYSDASVFSPTSNERQGTSVGGGL